MSWIPGNAEVIDRLNRLALPDRWFEIVLNGPVSPEYPSRVDDYNLPPANEFPIANKHDDPRTIPPSDRFRRGRDAPLTVESEILCRDPVDAPRNDRRLRIIWDATAIEQRVNRTRCDGSQIAAR
jgi:hypothetical protein